VCSRGGESEREREREREELPRRASIKQFVADDISRRGGLEAKPMRRPDRGKMQILYASVCAWLVSVWARARELVCAMYLSIYTHSKCKYIFFLFFYYKQYWKCNCAESGEHIFLAAGKNTKCTKYTLRNKIFQN
jgi:hypothetical protein